MAISNHTPITREWIVDGVIRQALVAVPTQAKTEAMPVVFAFHGHSGTMAGAAGTFGFQTIWPEALVVYPQGLNTPGVLYDPEGKLSGWQHIVGGQGDRDLKFFDAVLATLRQEYRVDNKRIYATGHSNGGFLVYLLWATRGDQLAAVAPSAAAIVASLGRLKPKPVLLIAGQNDTSVKFSWQLETLDGLRKLNECGAGQAWCEQPGCTFYPSKRGTPIAAYIHPGGHDSPADTSAVAVKFFKEHSLP
ncbi:MAG: prolyl oligopeptidase family serine peptidase [Verrucomicrobiota bacterium]